MKKISIAALLIVLILLLAAACGKDEPQVQVEDRSARASESPGGQDSQNTGGNAQQSSPSPSPSPSPGSSGGGTGAKPPEADYEYFNISSLREPALTASGADINWPAADLPPGFPVYPGGTILIAEYDEDGDFLVYITDTDVDAYVAFKAALAAAGWELDAPSDGWDFAYFDDTFLILAFLEEDAAFYYCHYSHYFEYDVYDWPATSLPAGFPVYPNGEIIMLDIGEEDILMFIDDSDRSTFSGYVDSLLADGWFLDDDDEVDSSADYEELSLYRGTYMVFLVYDEGSVILMVWDLGYEFLPREWPANLDYDVPEYPDGDIEAVFPGLSGTVYIMIVNTSREAYELYIEMLLAGGAEQTGDDEDAFMALFSIGEGSGFLSIMLEDDETEVLIIIGEAVTDEE